MALPFANSHYLMTASGSLPGNEVWSCGLRSGFAAPDDFTTQVANIARGAWITFFAFIGQYMGAGVTLDLVQARQIGTNGLTQRLSEARPDSAIPGVGQASLPNQCAVVATLLTDTAGRAGKGRIFLPLLSVAVQDQGRMIAAYSDKIADGVRSLIEDINAGLDTLPQTPNHVSVQSRSPVVRTSEVTSVGVGRVIDTQRRRRDSLRETYSVRPVTS